MKWTCSDRAQNTQNRSAQSDAQSQGRRSEVRRVDLEPCSHADRFHRRGNRRHRLHYHPALHELIAATRESGHQEQLSTLLALVEGGRLRDISDLPLDLAL
ncbi:MAG: NgoMIV family type II restriction endonuclease [Phycisphaerales bacterium]